MTTHEEVTDAQLLEILAQNLHLRIVYRNPPDDPHRITCVCPHSAQYVEDFQDLNPTFCVGPEIRDLRLRFPPPTHRRLFGIFPVRNINQQCQDEPVLMGTQIQPYNAPWVGTAGCTVTWNDPQGNRRYGILSNFHVMVLEPNPLGRAIHQPDSGRSPVAHLTRFVPVSPDQPNRVDCSLADALVEDYHTVALEIVGLGIPNTESLDASPSLAVTKSGRTTGVTTGRCSAVGAAVRVGYGDFTALFTDQDVFEDTGSSFSAAGDSGSLILEADTLRPTALLFAGGGNMTIGNPIRHVMSELGVSFPG